jgi:hypothetical protein
VGSSAAVYEERAYPTEVLVQRLRLNRERMEWRGDRYGDDTLHRAWAALDRWAERMVRHANAVRVSAVVMRDTSRGPDSDDLGVTVKVKVKVARGPIPGLAPGQFVPVPDSAATLIVPVLKGAEGWKQGPMPTVAVEGAGLSRSLFALNLIEVPDELLMRVANRAHRDHADWPIGECTEPDCIAMRRLLGW